MTYCLCIEFADCAGRDLQSTLVRNSSAPLPVLPALRYGMNLQLLNPQPAVPAEAPFRILTTCSWEQSSYTVKLYVPLHGVKTELLRAVFEPNSLEIKAVNLQVVHCAVEASFLVQSTASPDQQGLWHVDVNIHRVHVSTC